MKYKLIGFDLDGTLTESGKSVDSRLILLLAELLSLCSVAIISGADWGQIKRQLLDHLPLEDIDHKNHFFVLPVNGSKMYQFKQGDWQLVTSKDLGSREKQEVIEAIRTVRCEEDNLLSSGDYQDRGSQITWSVLGNKTPLFLKRAWDPQKNKIRKITKRLAELLPEYNVKSDGLASIDINDQSDSKGEALKKLCFNLGLSSDEVLYVGDALFPGGNDHSVLESGFNARSVTSPEDSYHLIKTLIKKKKGIRLERFEGNPVLRAFSSWPWADRAVFNPAAVELDGKVYLLYRAVGHEEKYISRLGLAKSEDGFAFQPVGESPVFGPEIDFEKGGVEDPRLVVLDGKLYLTYTAVGDYLVSPGWEEFGSGSVRTCGALASTSDLSQFQRLGIITDLDANDKNVVLFSKKVNGRYVKLHRPSNWCRGSGNSVPSDFKSFKLPEKPSIWISYSDDLLTWSDHQVLIEPEAENVLKVGSGPPPILTDQGWLLIYHQVFSYPNGVYYDAKMALLDRDDPEQVLARSQGAILTPKFNYEIDGDVNNVVFPTGAVIQGDKILVYYGAADKYCALAVGSVGEILRSLTDLG